MYKPTRLIETLQQFVNQHPERREEIMRIMGETIGSPEEEIGQRTLECTERNATQNTSTFQMQRTMSVGEIDQTIPRVIDPKLRPLI